MAVKSAGHHSDDCSADVAHLRGDASHGRHHHSGTDAPPRMNGGGHGGHAHIGSCVKTAPPLSGCEHPHPGKDHSHSEHQHPDKHSPQSEHRPHDECHPHSEHRPPNKCHPHSEHRPPDKCHSHNEHCPPDKRHPHSEHQHPDKGPPRNEHHHPHTHSGHKDTGGGSSDPPTPAPVPPTPGSVEDPANSIYILSASAPAKYLTQPLKGEIEAASRKTGVPANRIAAVMWAESRNKPESSHNPEGPTDVGWMQESQQNYNEVRKSQHSPALNVNNEADNIEAGAWELRDKYQHANGSWSGAHAAYRGVGDGKDSAYAKAVEGYYQDLEHNRPLVDRNGF